MRRLSAEGPGPLQLAGSVSGRRGDIHPQNKNEETKHMFLQIQSKNMGGKYKDKLRGQMMNWHVV